MRNYIILNNKNSNTISGLIIQELAPISKPLQRTQVETIDGRDGDIVTPLGYAAYNKKIKIGLYGNFDINEVIAYFATKGTVIFSNEPDKYYYYQIVDQIDYERLVRYRVATVTMHVQPFKYSATEGTITVDASDTVSGEGSDIVLDGTAEAPFNTLRHKGNATQKTTSGKNLIKVNDVVNTNQTIQYYRQYSPQVNTTLEAGQTYTFSADVTIGGSVSSCRLNMGCGAGAFQRDIYGETVTSGRASITFTPTADQLADGRTQFYFRFPYISGTTEGVDYSFKNVMLEKSAQATDYEPFTNGASPNPDYPQDIQVVSGDSTVKITGKNLLEIENGETDQNGLKITMDNGEIILNGTATATTTRVFTAAYWTLKAGTYTLSANNPTYQNTGLQIKATEAAAGNPDISGMTITLNNSANKTHTFTLTEDKTLRFYVRAGAGTYANFKIIPQLELGDQATDYEEFKGQSYVIPFGDTYLAKIGDYVDEPVKVGDTWYIRRKIGKVVLDGSNDENWSGASGTGSTDFYFLYSNTIDSKIGSSSPQADALCDNFTNFGGLIVVTTITDSPIFSVGNTSSNRLRFMISKAVVDSTTAWRTWLTTHPTTVYYALATPTDEEITDQDLIDALDDFYDQAHGYKGHTHITATAADGNAPAVLAVDVNEDNESTVTNAGNTTSRPILTIYGQGDIGVYINDVEVLDVALGDEGYITLDSVEMEAYKDTTANLKNRLVTGDYSKLALNAGANKIRFTGKVTKYEISKYSRWL